MTTNQTFNLTRLAQNARWCHHWTWIDGMRWYVLADAYSNRLVSEGIVGAGDPPPHEALPDLANPDTLDAVANRVRYLYELPDLVCQYDERHAFYRINLPDGTSVSRYSPAGAWVALLELWSYQAIVRNNLRRHP